MILKRILFVLMCIFAVLASVAKNDDKEDVHVKVVLVSGDTITGYLRHDFKTGVKNLFSQSGGGIRAFINVGEQPTGGEPKRYKASEVKEYRFLEPTEGYPDGKLVVSERINSPIPFKPNHDIRGLVLECDRRDSGSILRWDIWSTNAAGNRVLIPVIGVKFKGARAAYGIISDGSVNLNMLRYYLKKQNPEFKKFLEAYYNKGKDSGAHRKELRDTPSTILLRYEEFLVNGAPISDPSADTPEPADPSADTPEPAYSVSPDTIPTLDHDK